MSEPEWPAAGSVSGGNDNDNELVGRRFCAVPLRPTFGA